MTTPTLELNIKASGVQEVKALKAALSELNGEVGKLTAFKNVSALDQLAQELKGMRDDMKSVMADIKKVVTEGIKGTFQQAQRDAQQGGQDLNRTFETALEKLKQTISKEGQERNVKLAELNNKAASEALKGGEAVGGQFVQGLEKSSARVKLAWGTLLGGGVKGSTSISGLDFTKLEEGIAKIKELPQFAAATAEAEVAAATKAEEAWSKYAYGTMSKITRLLEQQKAEAAEKAAAELAAANRAEEAWGKYAYTVAKSVNKLYTDRAATALKTAEAEAAAAKKSEDSWAQYAYRTTQNLNKLYEAKRAAESKALLDTAAAQARYQIGPATGNASGPYTSLLNGQEVNPQKLNSMTEALKAFTLTANDAHSAARGLASGFGLLWLTWGAVLPLLAGAAVSNAFTSVIRLGAEVNNTMAVIHVLAEESTESVAALTNKLYELGQKGPFGPTEIAKAMKTLSLAGLDAKDTYTAITDVLQFAVAGDTNIEKAADVLTTVGTAFNIQAKNYGYISDVISVAAAQSKSSVEGMGEAFKTASVINQQYGVSLEDTALGLSLLANAGIQNTSAGTAMRNMYADLAGRAPKVTQALKELGVEAIDPLTGKMKDLTTIFTALFDALSQRTPTAQFKYVKDIFSERGAKEAIAVLTELRKQVQDTGQDVGQTFEQLKQKIDESAGFTAIAAAQMSLTPLNQMKSTVSALQTTFVQAFEKLAPVLTHVAEQLREVFGSEDFKSTIEGITLAIGNATAFLLEHAKAIATVALAYVAMRSVVTTIVAVTAAIKAWGEITVVATTAVGLATRAATVMNPLLAIMGTALTVAAAGWAAYSLWAGKAKDKTDELADGESAKKLLAKLQEEEERLIRVNTARSLGISLMELEAKAALEKARSEKPEGMSALDSALAQNKAQYTKVTTSDYGTTPQGEREAQRLVGERAKIEKQIGDMYATQGEQLLKIERTVEHIKELRKEQADQVKKDQADWKAGLPQGALDKPPKMTAGLKSDNDAATIVANFRTADSLLKDGYADQQAITDNAYKNKLISEGKYFAKSIQDYEAYHDQVLALTRSAEVALAAEYVDNLAKINKEVKPEERARAIENLTNTYTKNASALSSAMGKLENDGVKKLTTSTQDADGALIKFSQSNDLYWAKAQQGLQKELSVAQARREYASATEEVRARMEAEAKVEESHQVKLTELQTAYETANQALADFKETMGDKTMGLEALKRFEILTNNVNATSAAIDKARGALDSMKSQAGDAAELEVQNKKIQELRDSAKSLAKTTASSIVDGLLTGGTDGVKKLKDAVKQAFLNPIRIVLQAFIQPYANQLVNAGYSALGLNNATSYGSGMNMFGGGLPNMFAGGSSWSMSNVGTSGQGLSGFLGFGNSMASSGATGAGAPASGVAELAGNSASNAGSALSSVGSALPYVGALFAAANKQYGQAAGMAIGTMIMPGIGTAIGAVIGSIVDSFSKSHGPKDESAFNYTYGVSDAALNNSAGAKAIAQAINTSYLGVANQLGLNNTALNAGVTYAKDPNGTSQAQLDVTTANYGRGTLYGTTENAGRTDAEFSASVTQATEQAIIAGLLNSNLDQKFKDYLGGIDLKSAGEDLAARIDTVINVKRIMAAFNQLGSAFAYVKDMTVDSISALISAGGGIEAFSTKLTSFYTNFFTEADKHRQLQLYLTEEFQKLNIVMPRTRLEFKNLVLAQDLTTTTGQGAFNALLNLSDAFAQLTQDTNSLTDATKSQSDLDQDVTDARSKLQSAYSTESDRLVSLRDHMQAFNDKMVAFLKEITSGDLSGLTPQQQYLAAKADFAKYAQELNSSDPTVRDDGLANIEDAGKALLEASRLMNGASDGYYSDLAAVKSAVEEAKDISKGGVDVANLQLTALNSLVQGLVDLRDTDQGSLSALYNVTGSGLASVVSALGTLQAAIIGAAAGPSPNTDTTTSAGNILSSGTLASSVVSSAITSYYQQYLGRAPEASGLSYWQNLYTSGVSLGVIQQSIKGSPESIEHNGGVPLRSGIDRVPYDNFPATLHKDETVLNAVESDKRRRQLAEQDDVIRELRVEIASLKRTVAEGLEKVVGAQFASTDRAAEKIANSHKDTAKKTGWDRTVREGAKVK